MKDQDSSWVDREDLTQGQDVRVRGTRYRCFTA